MYFDLDPTKVKKLLKVVKGNRFHFIIIQYNQYDIIYKIKKILHNEYPTRPALSIQSVTNNYENITDQILKKENTFIFIDDFEKIIRSYDLYIKINQQRDKITSYPIQLICFIPSIDIYLKELIQNLPDFWSIRDIVIEFKTNIKQFQSTDFDIAP